MLMAGILMVALSGLAACASEEPVEEPTPVEEEAELRAIGKPSDGAIEIIALNDTGKDITGVAIKTSGEEAFGASLISEKEKIEDGEKVQLYLPVKESAVDAATEGSGEGANVGANASANSNAAGSASSGAAAGSNAVESAATDAANPANDVILRTLYDVSLTFDDESTAVLHNINLDELEEVTVLLAKEGIAYITYETDSGKTESTLETEKALKEAADAAAQAQAEAEAAAAAAAAQAQAEAEAAAAAAASQNSYDYGYSYDTGSSGGYTDNSGSYSGSQTEDSCVDSNDLVFN